MENTPTTDPRAASPLDESPPALPEVKSGVELPLAVSQLRWKLGRKAKQEPRFRFYVLYDRIYRLDVLTAAWHLVLKNNGKPGVDGVCCKDILQRPGGVAGFLKELQEELQSKRYQPQPVRRAYIEKQGGGLRPLGIPTVKDRIVQAAAYLILEPIFEADFLDSSFGFRPEKNAHQALAAVRDGLQSGLREVYDADLKSYFDTIPHDQLLAAVRMRVVDRSVLRLMRLWLQAPIVATDRQGRTTVHRSRQGTPQGGVISPLLANIYLHWFEKRFYRPEGPATWAKAQLVRYADDFVILARYQGQRLVQWVESTLEQRFKLTINREKTRVVRLNSPHTSLDFLGFTFRYDADLHGRPWRYLNLFPAKKSLARVQAKLRDLTSNRHCFQPITEMIGEINKLLRSWKPYFAFGYPRDAFRHVNKYLLDRLIRHLARRSQRPFRKPEGVSYYAHLQALGLEFL